MFIDICTTMEFPISFHIPTPAPSFTQNQGNAKQKIPSNNIKSKNRMKSEDAQP